MHLSLSSKLSMILLLFANPLLWSCESHPASNSSTPQPLARAESIPLNAHKISPEEDLFPPQLHSQEWEQPIPVPGPINTTGAEDSPFITPDGKTLTFFFTPDPNVPAEVQIVDGVTGIYISHNLNGEWSEPERMVLQDPGKLSLDGCLFLQGNIAWFCSAREGNFKGIDFWHAVFEDGKWTQWENAGEQLNQEYEIGEMHITADGQELYYHAQDEGGKGDIDIWRIQRTDGTWSTPIRVEAVNSEALEGWPFLTQDGNELWFLRVYQGSPGIFRSIKINDHWSEPQLILSQFAGEPSLDQSGNIYFVHHYYKDGIMLEADIYVAYKK